MSSKAYIVSTQCCYQACVQKNHKLYSEVGHIVTLGDNVKEQQRMRVKALMCSDPLVLTQSDFWHILLAGRS